MTGIKQLSCRELLLPGRPNSEWDLNSRYREHPVSPVVLGLRRCIWSSWPFLDLTNAVGFVSNYDICQHLLHKMPRAQLRGSPLWARSTRVARRRPSSEYELPKPATSGGFAAIESSLDSKLVCSNKLRLEPYIRTSTTAWIGGVASYSEDMQHN